jgi:hypothetical protein
MMIRGFGRFQPTESRRQDLLKQDLLEELLAFSSTTMIAAPGLREIIASWMIADLQDHRETTEEETIAEDQEDPNKDSVVL